MNIKMTQNLEDLTDAEKEELEEIINKELKKLIP
jgi:hypothetical protein